ncbi:hypothetical protein EVA_01327 [gut metagenome]|uniref:Uncharacterized protein n=1 Tax=gut metagenome TaxID=749906 RepID=J9DBV2_9ZZZZ
MVCFEDYIQRANYYIFFKVVITYRTNINSCRIVGKCFWRYNVIH